MDDIKEIWQAGKRDNLLQCGFADELIAGIYYVPQPALTQQYLGRKSRLAGYALEQTL